MGIMDFYRLRKPSKFRHIYRYYDPKKEELERKIAKARRKLDPNAPLDPEEIKENLRGAFHRQSTTLKEYDRTHQKPDLVEKSSKLIITLVLLVVLFIWLYRNIGIKYFSYYFGINL